MEFYLRKPNEELYEKYKKNVAAGKESYREGNIELLAGAAGIDLPPPPTEMPLPPEMTVGARRQGAARKRRTSQGRTSTIMTAVGFGEERDSLG